MSSRHSAFYTPLLLAVELGSTDQSFMKSVSEDFECSYTVAENNENVYEKVFNNENEAGEIIMEARKHWFEEDKIKEKTKDV